MRCGPGLLNNITTLIPRDKNSDNSALAATRDVARGIRILRKIGRFEYSANSIRD
jgi:hypothetical protein